jgi:hypothetical protein
VTAGAAFHSESGPCILVCIGIHGAQAEETDYGFVGRTSSACLDGLASACDAPPWPLAWLRPKSCVDGVLVLPGSASAFSRHFTVQNYSSYDLKLTNVTAPARADTPGLCNCPSDTTAVEGVLQTGR